jgi:hypothetical protein
LQPRAGALDFSGLRRVLGVDLLQFLPAGGTDLHELLRALEFSVVCIEHRLCGDVLRSRLGHFRAVHLRERLPLAHTLAQLRRDADDASADQRRH